MTSTQQHVEGRPSICGREEAVAQATARERPGGVPANTVDFARARSACAIALHMHQPLVPAGGGDLATAEIIGNLQHMMEHQDIGDNHNAPVFYQCYKRMGEFVPQLVDEGRQPRAMLEYSGCLFHGLKQMGSDDLFDALRRITVDPAYRDAVEWLGCPWGHAVAPSTPVQDYRLHVRAWQHHFADLFGWEALERVQGFSPSEMALPNEPDVAHTFVKTLNECGFRWVLVQEHTVEQPDGRGVEQKHLPHRLVCTNSHGETASITALVKTQGSDTKLVAQMQPYYEARSLERLELNGRSVPPLVTQIADGENGGVMMNEFPPKFLEAVREASHSETPLMNGSEYLAHLVAMGLAEDAFPVIQPVQQKKLWDRVQPGAGPEALRKAIEEIQQEDHQFHMEGGSWTNDLSWVRGYENVLGPMREASALFNEKMLQANTPTSEPAYANALYHLMVAQTSCYRYWGQGQWTDYGREICRRAIEIIRND